MTVSEELTCKELVELVTDYLDGALSERERARFDAHLMDCPGCATYVDQMRRTIRVLGALSEDTIDASAREELLRVFRHWKRG